MSPMNDRRTATDLGGAEDGAAVNASVGLLVRSRFL
jgi:hypothetical protein